MDKDYKTLSGHLQEAMLRENLTNREVAGFLNLAPCYISMILRPELWQSASKAAWDRIKEWSDARVKISEFKIPEGEEIWKPPVKNFDKMAKDIKGSLIKKEKKGPPPPPIPSRTRPEKTKIMEEIMHLDNKFMHLDNKFMRLEQRIEDLTAIINQVKEITVVNGKEN